MKNARWIVLACELTLIIGGTANAQTAVVSAPATSAEALPSCVVAKAIAQSEIQARLSSLTSPTITGPIQTKLDAYKVGGYYLYCFKGLTVTTPLTLKNNRDWPVILDGEGMNLSDTASQSTAAITVSNGKSPIILRNVTIKTPYRALKISGVDHQLINVTLDGGGTLTRTDGGTGLQLANAIGATSDGLKIDGLKIYDYANGVLTDAVSAAMFINPVISWRYKAGAGKMQGTIGLGVEPAGASSGTSKLTLVHPLITGFEQGMQVFAGKQLIVKGGTISAYPDIGTTVSNKTAAELWPGTTGLLLSGDGHQILPEVTVGDDGDSVTTGTLITGFREQILLDGENITLDSPVLELATMSTANVDRCWMHGDVKDCDAKGIEGMNIHAVPTISTTHFRSQLAVDDQKISHNFVNFPDLVNPPKVESVAIGKRCNKRVEKNGYEVCDISAETKVERIVGKLPDTMCVTSGVMQLMVAREEARWDTRIESSCAIAPLAKDTTFVAFAGDGKAVTTTLPMGTCSFECAVQLDGSSALNLDLGVKIAPLQQLPDGYIQWPVAMAAGDQQGSYVPISLTDLPDIPPTTPGVQAMSPDTPNVMGGGDVGDVGGGSDSGGDSPSVVAVATPDTPQELGSSNPVQDLQDDKIADKDAGDAASASSGNHFSTETTGMSGIVSTGGSGMVSSGAGVTGTRGCSLIVE